MPLDTQARLWEYYQNQRPESFSWAAPRLAFLAAEVARIAHGRRLRVLTIGAGDSSLEQRLLAAGHEVTTVDLDEKTVARLRDIGVTGIHGSLIDVAPFDESFDVAVASEVLEHIDNAELPDSLQTLVRALRRGGLLLVTVPRQEDLARSMSMCPNCGHRYHTWGHRQSFTRESLAQNLRDAGFRDIVIRERMFVNYRMLNWGGRLVHFLRHASWRVFRRPNSSLKYYAVSTK